MVSDALGVIPRGGRNYAVVSLFASKREQFVQRAALFKSAGALLIVQLQKNGVASQLGKSLGVSARRDADVAADAIEGCANIRKIDHGARQSSYRATSAAPH